MILRKTLDQGLCEEDEYTGCKSRYKSGTAHPISQISTAEIRYENERHLTIATTYQPSQIMMVEGFVWIFFWGGVLFLWW